MEGALRASVTGWRSCIQSAAAVNPLRSDLLVPRTPTRLHARRSAVVGSAAHASAKREATLVAGVPGTTCKKKSRQGSPEDTNVGDAFSVSLFFGGGFLGAATGGRAVAAAAAASRRNSTGGPTRLDEKARRHGGAAIGSRLLGFFFCGII
jgi:hypothetical protein